MKGATGAVAIASRTAQLWRASCSGCCRISKKEEEVARLQGLLSRREEEAEALTTELNEEQERVQRLRAELKAAKAEASEAEEGIRAR